MKTVTFNESEFKLVPIEPTPEMLEAARRAPLPAVMVDSRSATENLQHKAAYAAMLGAAPCTPASVAPGDAQKVYHFEQRSQFGPWIEVEKPTAKSVEFVKRSEAPAAGDALDAARYRKLRRKVCIAGGQFHILNLAPTYVAPDAAVELDSVLDAALAAQAPHNGGAA